MKPNRQLKSMAIGIATAGVLAVTPAIAQDTNYILNTASTGGTYHPVGTAIATLSKIKLLPKQKFSLTAVNSAGSGANVQALGANTAQFAIVQGLFGSYAATGESLVHFGVPAAVATSSPAMTIDWPSGKSQTVTLDGWDRDILVVEEP